MDREECDCDEDKELLLNVNEEPIMHLYLSNDAKDNYEEHKDEGYLQGSLYKDKGFESLDANQDDSSQLESKTTICNCRSKDFYPLAKDYSVNAPPVSYDPDDYRLSLGPSQLDCEQYEFKKRLEFEIADVESNELEANCRHNALREKYMVTRDILNALEHYTNCLQLETKASVTLCKCLDMYLQRECNFAKTETFDQLISKLCCGSKFSYERFKMQINKVTRDECKVERYMHDNYEKESDFKKAISNFRIVLKLDRITFEQLAYLKKQFDTILEKYQQCHHQLKDLLSKLITARIDFLVNACRSMGEELQGVANSREDLSLLFIHLESSLKLISTGNKAAKYYNPNLNK